MRETQPTIMVNGCTLTAMHEVYVLALDAPDGRISYMIARMTGGGCGWQVHRQTRESCGLRYIGGWYFLPDAVQGARFDFQKMTEVPTVDIADIMHELRPMSES